MALNSYSMITCNNKQCYIVSQIISAKPIKKHVLNLVHRNGHLRDNPTEGK